MSQIILVKTADCTEIVETTVVIDIPSQFTLNTNSTVNATIYFDGALVKTLNHSNPTHEVSAIGEYTVILTGTCKQASVCVSPIGDATDILVQQVLDKLSEACDGSPINVNVCNQIDLTNIENSLNSILLSVQAIDANTDNVETLLQTTITALGNLDSDDDATALATINTSIQDAITELQAVNANTDNIEALLTALNTSLIAESNETQVLLTTINNTVQAVVNKLSEDCTGSPVNVRLCVTAKTDQTHAIINGTNINIPTGTKSVLINNLSGITTVNGGFQLGNGRRLVSVSYDATTVEPVRGLLPAFTLSGGTYQWTAIQPIAEQ